MEYRQMAKCPKCQKRKAKRFCPALRASLCSLCCGRLREKEIDCSPDCPYLEKHKSYQAAREMEKKAPSGAFPLSPEEDILRDERMAWLALHIEAPLKTFAERDSSLSDRDALYALEYAKKKSEIQKQILVFESNDTGPSNELGEMILQSMNRCRYEKKIILPDEHLAYSDEEKVKCLERIILSVRHSAQGNLGERRYIQSVLERFSQIKNLSQPNTLISMK